MRNFKQRLLTSMFTAGLAMIATGAVAQSNPILDLLQLPSKVQANTATNDNQQTQIDGNTTTNAAQDTRLNTHYQAIQLHQLRLNNHQRRLNAQDQLIEDNASDIANNAAKNADQDGRLDSVEAENRQQNNAIQRGETIDTLQNGAILGNALVNAVQQGQINNLQTENAQQNTAITNNASNILLNSQGIAHNANVNTLQQSQIDENARVNTVQTQRLDRHGREIRQNTQGVEANRQANVQQQAEINANTAGVSANAVYNTIQDTRMSGIESNVSSNRVDIDQNRSDINRLNKTSKKHRKAIAALSAADAIDFTNNEGCAFGGGVGFYRNEVGQAAAVGCSFKNPNHEVSNFKSMSVRGHVAHSGGEIMSGLGATFTFGTLFGKNMDPFYRGDDGVRATRGSDLSYISGKKKSSNEVAYKNTVSTSDDLSIPRKDRKAELQRIMLIQSQ